jgi:hypothetical protein
MTARDHTVLRPQESNTWKTQPRGDTTAVPHAQIDQADREVFTFVAVAQTPRADADAVATL